MPMVEAIKACFAKYAAFDGRAARPESWWFLLAVTLASAIASVVALRLYTLVALVTLLPTLAVGTRRLHDTNRSGWWQLMGLVPIAGIFVVFILMAQPGAPPQNAAQPAAVSQT